MILLALAFASSFLLFAVEGNKGFNMRDEGFLWYGAQQVTQGGIPIRDFMAYDPGRYLWSAIFMKVFDNNGIMSLRFSVTIFQALGLFASLLIVTRSTNKQNIFFAILSGAILLAWMFPRHKLFDICLCIFAIYNLAFLIANPTTKNFILHGIAVGLIAFFGRNHGVYALTGSVGAIAWLHLTDFKHIKIKNLCADISYLGGGVVIGSIPTIAMAATIPGFAVAFLESITFLYEIKATNLPLPVPWPWLIDFSSPATLETIKGLAVGSFFIFILAYGIVTGIYIFYRKIIKAYVSPYIVASSLLALPYAHFAFSRADISHLAQGIFPVLIGSLVFLNCSSSKIKWGLVSLLLALSLLVMLGHHPSWQCLTPNRCINITISADELLVEKSTVDDVNFLRRIVKQYTPMGESFAVMPFWPGAYPLFEKKSPLWEIYALFPRPKAFELREITRLRNANIKLVIINDQDLDGRDELRFINTHPMTYQYVLDNFIKIPYPDTPNYMIFIAKEDLE